MRNKVKMTKWLNLAEEQSYWYYCMHFESIQCRSIASSGPGCASKHMLVDCPHSRCLENVGPRLNSEASPY